MRLGVVWFPNANANYRALEPAKHMARRGHEVVWPLDDGSADLARLASCDVVHVFRRFDPATRTVLSQLAAQGVATTYDNDDDFTTVPDPGGEWKTQFAEMVAIARGARIVTTTNEQIAEAYRAVGVKRVEVIPNAVLRNFEHPLMRPDGVVVGWQPIPEAPIAARGPGFVVGWLAGAEHELDAERLDIAAALARLAAERPEVHVETIGVRLPLTQQYTHYEHVRFDHLASHMAVWDVGIAPLADIPFNRARSDIKLKEYGAAGVPWLASPVGPYRDLGEAQGGRLVGDSGWYEALRALVENPGDRDRLAVSARRWGESNLFESVAGAWERVFAELAPAAAPPSPLAAPSRARRRGFFARGR